MYAQLLKDLNADPVVKNRIMIDIMNEPEARQLRCGHWMCKILHP